METAAVVIGIDAYLTRPLTSCVNDACDVAATLVDLGLVAEADVTLLTSPVVAGAAGPADADTIRSVLLQYYRHGHDLDRLYVYFAGHGVLGRRPGSAQGSRTVLVPANVVDFADEGHKMIDLDELHEYLRLVGPREQFYFIDACRNLDYSVSPMVGTLGWGDEPVRGPRSQSTLYAVAELGVAGGEPHGNGFMTGHLIEALRGTGSAVDYNAEQDAYEITAASVREYVGRKMARRIAADPDGMLGITVPQLDGPDPRPTALRRADPPGDVPLVIRVVPIQAEPHTEVRVSFGGGAGQWSWPPNRYHHPISLRPTWYRLDATSTFGSADPTRRMIDLREESEATVRVGPVVGDGAGDTGLPAPARLETRGPSVSLGVGIGGAGAAGYAPTSGHVRATAAEAVTVVELAQLEPPYQTWTGSGELDADVPPGPYTVTFRLGHDVFSTQEVYVTAGENLLVEAQVRPSVVMQDVLGLSDSVVTAAEFSESIGPIQCGMDETMLPILGIKPFDVDQQVFRRFDPLFPERTDPILLGNCTVSVVVAVDGRRDHGPWADPTELLRTVRVEVGSAPGDHHELPVRVLPGDGATDRVAVGWAAQPPGPFRVRVSSEVIGELEIPTAALPGRATVITVRLRPGGTELSQNILQYPGQVYPHEPGPPSSYGRMVRDLQLGMQLYSSGELADHAWSSDVLMSLLYAKWTDPVMGCMATFSLWDADPGRRYQAEAAAHNLVTYFPLLVDGHVALGLTRPERQEAEFDAVLAADDVPVLARSVRELAAYADRTGWSATAVQRAVRRIPARSPWSASALVSAATVRAATHHAGGAFA